MMWRSGAILLIGLILSGCASRPDGLMRPVAETAPGARQVPIIVATTRRAAKDPGVLFTGERGRALSYFNVTISVPPGHKSGEIEWPSSFPGDPKTNFVTTQASPIVNDTGFRAAIRQAVAKRGARHVLLFVHGYNNAFEDTVYRFAQIVNDSGADVVPVLFTWPSKGQLLAYPYDRESATYSRDALEKVVQELAAEPSVSQISILAHSMGNWVTLEALRQQAIRKGRVAPKVRDVMLAAPDVDVDVARTEAQSMGPNHPKFTLFVSRDDRGLAVSRRFWGGLRLGAIDPTKEPYRSALEQYGVHPVDLTDIKSEDGLNHGKFAQSGVVTAIGQQLATGQAIETRGPTLGEGIATIIDGATNTIGSAANIAVSAPIAIVDPQTRENMSERLGALVGADDQVDALAVSDKGKVAAEKPQR